MVGLVIAGRAQHRLLAVIALAARIYLSASQQSHQTRGVTHSQIRTVNSRR